MKILRVSLENVNSLAGPWEIDLTRPEYRDGLFLISGETGAGKTTVLDAITLALFGQTARVDMSQTHNEAMTRGTRSCSAEVEFSDGRGVYRAHWEQRRSRERSQMPFQQPEMRLESLQDGKWVEFPGKTTEVKKEVMRLIGAESFDQFLRTTMLAQGKFDEFLSVKNGANDVRERSKILEQATGTEIYSKIGDAIHRRAKAEQKCCDDLVKQKQGADALLLSDEERSKMEADAGSRRGEETALAQAVAALEAECKWHADRKAIAAERENVEREERALGSRKALFAHEDELAKRAREALKHRPEAEKAAAAESAAAEAREDLAVRVEDLEKADEALARAREAKEKAQEDAAAAGEERDRMKGPIARAAELDGKIAHLLVERKAADESRSSAENAVAQAEKTLSDGSPYIERQLAEADECKANREAPSPMVVEAKRRMDGLLLARDEKFNAKSAVDVEYDNRHGDLEKAIEIARADLVEAEQVSTYEEKRKTLEDGKACPLCGSTSHPYCAGIVPRPDKYRARLDEGQAALRDLVGRRDGARKAFDEADKAYREAEQAFREASDERREEEARLAEKEAGHRANARARRELMEDVERRLPGMRESLAGAASAVRGLDERIASLREERAGLGVEGDPEKARERLQGVFERLSQAKEQAIARYSACESGKAQAQREMEKAARSADELEEAAKKSRAGFDAVLRESGYADFADWERACWNERDILRVETERAQIKTCEDGICALRKACEGREAEFAKRAASAREEDAAAAELAEKRRLLKSAHDEAVSLESRLGDDMAKRAEMRGLADRIAEATETAARWGTLDKEIGGDNGSCFKLYAQGITLAQLVEVANRHLDPMTNGRYLMIWDAEGGDAAQLLPTIVDRRAGGERRPVTNLSGGERFQVSLALAIGLSELNAGKLCVETLFLDEGFGTLDEKTLDVSIATLEGLQRDGSKTIGIISHVRELDARIPAKIVATKKGNGMSELSGPGVSAGQAKPQAVRRRSQRKRRTDEAPVGP